MFFSGGSGGGAPVLTRAGSASDPSRGTGLCILHQLLGVPHLRFAGTGSRALVLTYKEPPGAALQRKGTGKRRAASNGQGGVRQRWSEATAKEAVHLGFNSSRSIGKVRFQGTCRHTTTAGGPSQKREELSGDRSLRGCGIWDVEFTLGWMRQCFVSV